MIFFCILPGKALSVFDTTGREVAAADLTSGLTVFALIRCVDSILLLIAK